MMKNGATLLSKKQPTHATFYQPESNKTLLFLQTHAINHCSSRAVLEKQHRLLFSGMKNRVQNPNQQ